MNICVFCSAQEVAPQYNEAAKEVGVLIARNGHTLVWGGSNRGVMRTIADSVQEHGGVLLGISMEMIKENARTNADEMVVEKDLAARKATILMRSDAFIALPGGIGTLDEITEIVALKRHKLHTKPAVFLNVGSFYAGMKVQLEAMENEGFFADGGNNTVSGLKNLVYFADTPEDAMRYIEAHGN